MPDKVNVPIPALLKVTPVPEILPLMVNLSLLAFAIFRLKIPFKVISPERVLLPFALFSSKVLLFWKVKSLAIFSVGLLSNNVVLELMVTSLVPNALLF